MNKKGFTIVELIVSFSLAITIGFFLFKITIIIKDLYTDSYIKTNIISKQNVMTERMYDDLDKAYRIGTVFPELNKPFTGRRCVK